MLEGIEVQLNTDYLAEKDKFDAMADKVIYTGPIDAYFDYKLGTLQYRSVRFETELLDMENYQGNAVYSRLITVLGCVPNSKCLCSIFLVYGVS